MHIKPHVVYDTSTGILNDSLNRYLLIEPLWAYYSLTYKTWNNMNFFVNQTTFNFCYNVDKTIWDEME